MRSSRMPTISAAHTADGVSRFETSAQTNVAYEAMVHDSVGWMMMISMTKHMEKRLRLQPFTTMQLAHAQEETLQEVVPERLAPIFCSKPRSSRRSASSSTSQRSSDVRKAAVLARWSSSRPGVATSTVTPLRSRAFSLPRDSPPSTAPPTCTRARAPRGPAPAGAGLRPPAASGCLLTVETSVPGGRRCATKNEVLRVGAPAVHAWGCCCRRGGGTATWQRRGGRGERGARQPDVAAQQQRQDVGDLQAELARGHDHERVRALTARDPGLQALPPGAPDVRRRRRPPVPILHNRRGTQARTTMPTARNDREILSRTRVHCRPWRRRRGTQAPPAQGRAMSPLP